MANSTLTPSNLLLLSAGSKVAIARIAKAAAQKRGVELHITDTTTQVPTFAVADHFSVLPSHGDDAWEAELITLCRSSKIGLIIPTRHSELLALAQIRETLETSGTRVSLSSKETLGICIQKVDTNGHFQRNGIPSPETCFRQDFHGQIQYPIVAKPNDGSSSTGLVIAKSREDLQSVPANWILQERVKGQEFTTNIYLNKRGEVICAIPHLRIATESGEVVQARTNRQKALIETCTKIAKSLPAAEGIINIQAFVEEESGEIKVIEINPRIGGGYPLCDAAKGHYIEWLCQEHLDHTGPAPFDSWTENLKMMRYREAIFTL